MTENVYPLLFVPVYKEYLWGGDRIGRFFKRPACPAVCAESWEISDRPDGMSVISNGMLSGASLHQVIEQMPEAILGPGKHQEIFPLLIKLIDAGQRLSVQVHPDEKTAEILGGEAKTEMWYILAAKTGAKIFAGLKNNIAPHDFEKAIKENTVDGLLNAIPVKEGDAIYIPGGTIHAIGEGCLILEIQQNSNTTYRVYDWNRVDKNGNPRELHVAQALKAINWNNTPVEVIRSGDGCHAKGNHIEKIVSCPFFTASRIDLKIRETVKNPCHTFNIIFLASGTAVIEANGSVQRLSAGNTCLLPAAIKEYSLFPEQGDAVAIHVSQPAVAG